MTDLADIVSSAFWRVNPPDADPVETREWLDAFDVLVETEGRERATFLLRKLLDHARVRRVPLPPVQIGRASCRERRYTPEATPPEKATSVRPYPSNSATRRS